MLDPHASHNTVRGAAEAGFVFASSNLVGAVADDGFVTLCTAAMAALGLILSKVVAHYLPERSAANEMEMARLRAEVDAYRAAELASLRAKVAVGPDTREETS